MKQRASLALFTILIPVLAEAADPAGLLSSIRARSEGALIEESVAVEQAAAEARFDAGAGLELRPGYSADESGLAVRLYVPSRWTNNKLREQLSLVAESEQLRVEELEWRELLSVYRNFCTYRMLRQQRELLRAEIRNFASQLERVDLAVQQHRFAVTDRARLYGQYLQLLNDLDDAEISFLNLERQLHLTLGAAADLDAYSKIVCLAPPSPLELNQLVLQALANRADCRLLDVDVRSMASAAALARSEDGFRLKHIQTEYNVDQTGDGEDRWNISAAFSLPWGHRKSDFAVYSKKQMLAISAMALRRKLIKEQLQSLLETSDAVTKQIERRIRLVRPLTEQLSADLKQLDNGSLGQLRDRMMVRERILDTSLQTVRMQCERERLAVDIAEQLGSLSP